MIINELVLDRKEIPISKQKGKNCEYYNVVVPVPEPTFLFFKNRNTYHFAENAILKTLNETINEAINYEFGKRIKYEKAIVSNCLEFPNCPVKKRQIMVLNNLDLLGEDNKPLESRMSDASYINIRISILGISDKKNDLESLALEWKAFLKGAKELKSKERIEKISNLLCNNLTSDGILRLYVPGNGSHLCPKKCSVFASSFNIDEKRLKNMAGTESIAYYPHNVDYFFQAILLREFALNYLNGLAKDIN